MASPRSRSLVRWPALVLAIATAGCGSSDAPPPPPSSAEANQAGSHAEAPQLGSLLTTDGELTGRATRHLVPVHAGDRVRVTLTSSAFEPALSVNLPTGEQLTNGDYLGDRTRSELEIIVPSAGDLKISVTSYDADGSGAYHLEVERVAVGASLPQAIASAERTHHQPFSAALIGQLTGAAAGLAGVVSGAAAAAPSPAPSAAAGQAGAREPTVTQIRVGDFVQSNLSAEDATLPSGEFADVFQLNVTEPTSLAIQMESRALDSFLLVTTPSGEHLENDDYGGTRNAELRIDATPGTYVIVATSYRAGEAGAYELKVLPTQASVGAPAQVAASPSADRVERGELAAGDRQLSSGEFYDEYQLSLNVGDAARVEARSTAFDTYLIVQAPSRDQQDNDDQAPGNRNAAIDFVARESGDYRVLITSYAPGETGAYELSMRGGAGSGATAPTAPTTPTTPPTTPTARPTAPQGTAAPAGATQAQRGTLAPGDRQLGSGEFYDEYPMSFPPGQPVSMRLESTAFDPYLIVQTPSGNQQDNDDYRSGTLTAGIDIPVAEAGNYRVLVTSYAPGERGAYVLTATSNGVPGGASPGGPGQPAASPGSSRSRVWAVSVGISDYPGSSNDLPECANDARRIIEALRSQGLTTPERELLLTDAQATRDNIRGAIQRVAQQIQPNDVFVFFYSGHGGQSRQRSNDPRELDGLDEYLYVYDGELLDDEMGRLVDSVRSRTTLFTLDSCFSGGFAKDVVTRPGIVGMFSSEEDVTSAVATRFQAGGYLAHFLRMGIQGEADNEPRDGALTIGELTHYVWLQYANQARDVRMQEGYQQLVVDRGAMRNSEVLWQRGS